MSNQNMQARKGERGNALFLILIAVALFAALSYAITQSGRGGGTLDKESAIIAAGQVVEYPATLRTAITRMIITGTPASGAGAVEFDLTPEGTTNELFSSAGGGMTDIPPPAASGATAWTYADAIHATDGFYIKDVGSNTSVSGREAVAVAQGVTLTVCQQINKGLGQASPYTPAALTAVMNWAAPLATYNTANANTLNGNGVGSAAANVDGESFTCVSNAVTAIAPYHYVHALIEQ